MFLHSTLKILIKLSFKVQYSQCIWDKDTDEMVWYPNEIDFCNSKFILPFLGYTEASNKEPLMVGINTVDDTALSTIFI